ncbi:family 10 glycosylhydrolase [Isoptericola sp. S6320L]|uniref:glycoside hydrolase family 10 protein n=1 Tax=Isoptericola sp. S6320L TaxID=2926411 RepID=UPI001FF4D8FB|nr:family 10 glycosylhydrolase [Isoptericola sp. S6320L]MCK0115954.1 family 10 glycosylhydrolase [Isoptericola sp. S6320L]
MIRTRRRTSAATALALLLAGLAGTTSATAVDAAGLPEAGDVVVAGDGAELTVTAVNPPSRTAGTVAVYTPAFGESTRTNAFGGEAVLTPGPEQGTYEVVSVCTALATCADPAWTPGDNAIPTDGLVLSVSPGGSPDVRPFLRDHVAAGDTITFREVVERSASTTLDAVDPTPENNPPGVDPGSGQCYPGCRGAEQLVQYTPASGRDSSGTNDFGYEVTVVGGTVVGAGGNDREIPADGYVLSGHGSRGTWLQTNAPVGATVEVDGTELVATVDERTAIYAAEQGVIAAQESVTAADAACLAFPRDGAVEALADAEALLDRARTAAGSGDAAAASELAQEASASASLAGYRTAESRPAEGRGVWVRPEETSPEAIRATLDRIEESGFNVVFLETFFQGTTIYPSQVAADAGITAQRPEMAGFDPLAVWISEAHDRGIELHPWIHTFFVGSEGATGGPGPILDVYPEWAAVEREDVGADRPMPSSQEPGYYFVDASHPEPRAYVASVLEEILTGYPVDGLHLDYIRYPVSEPWETAGYSYSDYSRAAFAEEAGVDPYTLTPADPAWETWTAWREANVTSFVSEVRSMQQEVAPEVPVSAAVFPDPSDGLAKKFQNWGDWVDQGYVDVLTGMSFGTSATSVAADTVAMRERVGEENLLYTATYGPFRGSTPQTMLDQVAAVGDAGSDGAALFAYNQVTDAQAGALAEGAFRDPAVVPHADRIRAVRVGVDALRDALGSARGECVGAGAVAAATAQLAAAERALDGDRPTAAIDALGRASDAVERGALDGEGPALFGSRAQRDLAMYDRWLTQVVAGR